MTNVSTPEIINLTKIETEELFQKLKIKAFNRVCMSWYSEPITRPLFSNFMHNGIIAEKPQLYVVDPGMVLKNSGPKQKLIPKLLIDDGELDHIFEV
jgi:hypothetical protein